MGEILIAGMASMLITIFLGPKFIEYLRVREFGQHIREDGPEGHHTKAGTPTMGGLIIFAAIVVPYLVLSERDASSLAVFGVALGCAALGFADDYIKIIKRRSLGLSGRYKLLGQLVLSFGLWWVARHSVGLEPRLYFRIGGGSVVRAIIVLREGEPSDALVQELKDHCRAQTAPYKAPRVVDFVDELPKTTSGKVKRAQLRAS